MNHTILLAIVVVFLLAASLVLATTTMTTTPALSAFARTKDDTSMAPMQKNNQHILQNGKDGEAYNSAVNLICASPGPCIVE